MRARKRPDRTFTALAGYPGERSLCEPTSACYSRIDDPGKLSMAMEESVYDITCPQQWAAPIPRNACHAYRTVALSVGYVALSDARSIKALSGPCTASAS